MPALVSASWTVSGDQRQMKIFYRLLKFISFIFAVPCGMCMAGFFSILALPTERKWLKWLVRLLIPLGFVLLIPAMLFYLLSTLFFLAGHHGLAVRGELEESGIRLSVRAQGRPRLLSWADIKEFRAIFDTPHYLTQAVLRSGEVVSIDEIDEEPLAKSLEQRGIPFVRGNRRAFSGQA
jgi:hypothetical protein